MDEVSPDRSVLTLVGGVLGALEREDFARALLDALHEVVPSTFVALNGIAPVAEDTWVVVEPDPGPELIPDFQRLAHQNPLIERLMQTQDGRAYRFSDVVTAEQLHALELYERVYRPLGVEYQIAFTLPAAPGFLLGVALSRPAANGYADYTDHERDLLNAARPYLIQAYRNVLAFEELRGPGLTSESQMEAAGLTPREIEVTSLAATGRTNQEIAGTLELSVRTVQKHLERAFRKLGVRSRTEAAALLRGARG